MKNKLFIILLLGFVIQSCNDDEYTPKPKGYPKISLPVEKGYKVYNSPTSPYSFEYPVYAVIRQDTNFFGAKPENPWWLNMDIPSLNARIHLSYKSIDGDKKTFYKLLEDTYQMTFKHTVKAEAIDKSSFHPSNGVAGQMFLVRGNAASANQFYITDSTKHFVRGALYFYCEPNEDSLMPVTKFVFRDIEHLIKTFKWK